MLPPILFFLLAATAFALPFLGLEFLSKIHQTGTPYWEIGISAALGIFFLIGARIQFSKNNSEILTFNTPRNLVTTGLFRISRNPMYLGFLLLLIATALYGNVWHALFAPVIFFLASNFWYIPFEENAALSEFSDDYRDYQSKVRKWI